MSRKPESNGSPSKPAENAESMKAAHLASLPSDEARSAYLACQAFDASDDDAGTDGGKLRERANHVVPGSVRFAGETVLKGKSSYGRKGKSYKCSYQFTADTSLTKGGHACAGRKGVLYLGQTTGSLFCELTGSNAPDFLKRKGSKFSVEDTIEFAD